MGVVTMPPMDQGSPQLWMHVSDVFHISGRGSVVIGQLEGSGYLNVGDMMTCAGRSWQVGGRVVDGTIVEANGRPVRFDIAFPLNGRKGVDSTFEFYISLGQAF